MGNLFKSIILSAHCATSAMATATFGQSCTQDGFELLYQSTSENGYFTYWEEHPASPASKALIKRHDLLGQILWTTEAERGCSQGVGRCWLTLGYDMDGQPFDELSIEMNYFSVKESNFLLFSQLSESITYTYFKSYPSNRFTLKNPTGQNASALAGGDYKIPNLFEETCKK